MAAADPRVAARFRHAGLRLLTPPHGLRLLAAALAALRPQSIAAPIAWDTLLPHDRPPPAVFAALVAERATERGTLSDRGPTAAGERAAPADGAAADALEVVAVAVASLLGARVPADQVYRCRLPSKVVVFKNLEVRCTARRCTVSTATSSWLWQPIRPQAFQPEGS